MQKVTNKNIEITIEKAYEHQNETDDNCLFYVYVTNTETECTNTGSSHETISRKDMQTKLTDFMLASTEEEMSQTFHGVNEVLIIDSLVERGVIDDICTAATYSLTDAEKEMIVYGEARGDYEIKVLDYSLLSKELHYRACKLEYTRAAEMTDYELIKWFVQTMLKTMQSCAKDCGHENIFAEELDELMGA